MYRGLDGRCDRCNGKQEVIEFKFIYLAQFLDGCRKPIKCTVSFQPGNVAAGWKTPLRKFVGQSELLLAFESIMQLSVDDNT